MTIHTLETSRLTLRQWQQADLPCLNEMGQDPEVMRYFPELLSGEQSLALYQKAARLIEQNGFGFWAVEEKTSGQFIGFVGLHQQPADSGFPCAPLVEVGWRLARRYWGKGYATEAATEALSFAFTELARDEIFAFTTLNNAPSRKVMERLGMVNINMDFHHPAMANTHPLSLHCLYRISRAQWL